MLRGKRDPNYIVKIDINVKSKQENFKEGKLLRILGMINMNTKEPDFRAHRVYEYHPLRCIGGYNGFLVGS